MKNRIYHVVVMENQEGGPVKLPWSNKSESFSCEIKVWYGATKIVRQVVTEIQGDHKNPRLSWKIGFYHVVVMENQEGGPGKLPWSDKIQSCSYGIKLWYGTTKIIRQVVT